MFKNPYEDPGDYYDKQNSGMAWDFPEDNLEIIEIDNYPYKVRPSRTNKDCIKRAEKLAQLRYKIDNISEYLKNNQHEWTGQGEFTDGVYIFLDIHSELPRSIKHVPPLFQNKVQIDGYSSKYLISDIPLPRKGEGKFPDFLGLCKPKMRYYSTDPHVGPDKNIRAFYKDIFLVPNLNGKELYDLVIHELAHTGCNHVQWRPEDHGADFQRFEKLLKNAAKKTGFYN